MHAETDGDARVWAAPCDEQAPAPDAVRRRQVQMVPAKVCHQDLVHVQNVRWPWTLDETYVHVLSQILHSSQDHAHCMLQCLMVTLCLLRVEELDLTYKLGEIINIH